MTAVRFSMWNRRSGAALAAALFSAATAMAAEPEIDAVRLASIGASPTVAASPQSATRFFAWVRPGQNSSDVVVARVEGQGSAVPVTVSAGESGIVASVTSPPRIAVGTKGEVYVLFEQRLPSPYLQSGRGVLKLARSTDGGRNFAPPKDVAVDSVETSAESAGLAVAPDGTVTVAWLDKRDAIARAKLPEDQRPKDVRWIDSDDPKVEVRVARSTDGGENFLPSVLIASDASEQSPVSVAIGSDGTYYAAWRAKRNEFKGSYDSVRDVVVASSADGGKTWSKPVKVHNDRFKAGSCPKLSHGIGVDSKGRLHVAWYTGTSVGPGVFYAVSTDQGKSFSAPLPLLTDKWVPYANVRLAIDNRDRALVAFEDRRDEQNKRVVLTRIDASATQNLLGSFEGEAPDVAAGPHAITFVFQDAKGDLRTTGISTD
jgi:hypothetical protein